jgi:hypothetical protein
LTDPTDPPRRTIHINTRTIFRSIHANPDIDAQTSSAGPVLDIAGARLVLFPVTEPQPIDRIFSCLFLGFGFDTFGERTVRVRLAEAWQRSVAPKPICVVW